MSDQPQGSAASDVTVEVPLLALADVHNAATGRAEHTYFDGNLGPRHSPACSLCKSIEAVRKVLNASR